MPDHSPRPQPPRHPPQSEPAPPPCQEPPRAPQKPETERCRPETSRKILPCQQSGSIGGFFKNLLPRDLDTGDLVVILLLLLMAGDCEEDKNTAMLTLVLYLFL